MGNERFEIEIKNNYECLKWNMFEKFWLMQLNKLIAYWNQAALLHSKMVVFKNDGIQLQSQIWYSTNDASWANTSSQVPNRQSIHNKIGTNPNGWNDCQALTAC